MAKTPLIAGGILLLGAGIAALLSDDDDGIAPATARRILLIGDSHLGSPAFRTALTARLKAQGAEVVGKLPKVGERVVVSAIPVEESKLMVAETVQLPVPATAAR